ncbi:zinc ABC transporter ATP-binding protein ZnuC [Brevirhabdus pacifica]|uniref:Zinc ABC transporter ATP-binding protein ZnuC n=1 Tax=Brevirhabdus pacifica TaxID=1267768 RepID=A0A1U7DM77_9RHOB|nr:zinc ABC transporter ATP-binding protein ZnuC [Brevirhabdus pacifica]
MIEAHGLAAGYPGGAGIHDVDFRITAGEIVTVIGPNGSGKSTLIKALIGVLRPGAGTIRRSPGLRIGYVPQTLEIGPALPMTVERFLSLPRGPGRAERAAALARVGAEGLEGRQMSRLSGGQFQRVLLARAILSRPQMLILDEPTKGLDQPGIAAFYRLLEQVRAETGCAVLLVSHDLHVVMGASDRVICMNGHVCCEGAPDAVADAPAYRALFGDAAAGALALYRHEHDHSHHHDHDHDHGHDHDHHGDGPAHDCGQNHGPARPVGGPSE